MDTTRSEINRQAPPAARPSKGAANEVPPIFLQACRRTTRPQSIHQAAPARQMPRSRNIGTRPTRGGIQPDEIGQQQCRLHQRKHGASKICPFSRHRKHSAYERPGAHYAPVIAEAQDTSRRVQATMRRRRPRLWHAWGQKLCGGPPHRVVRLSHAQAYGRVRQASGMAKGRHRRLGAVGTPNAVPNDIARWPCRPHF